MTDLIYLDKWIKVIRSRVASSGYTKTRSFFILVESTADLIIFKRSGHSG
tara:strand:+ start:439 stop:588 length:150 start_codon:yes stop_codon:yes gene_type:complete